MMFTKTRSYVTPYSSGEVKNILIRLLETKKKFLFFSYKSLFGSVGDKAFIVTNSQGSDLLTPMIKGEIFVDTKTLITLKLSFPILLLLFFVAVPIAVFAMILPYIFSTEPMLINGILRELTWLERTGAFVACIVFPSTGIYFNIAHPIRSLRRKLIVELKLEEVL